MKRSKTPQESFWAGEFGNEYNKRNTDEELRSGNIRLFSRALKDVSNIESIIEFGANIGSNILALKTLLPTTKMSAVEINDEAVLELKKIKELKIYHDSILNIEIENKYDLVLIKIVLIHINPSMLKKTYGILYKASKKYILIAEYYNPTPVKINYRGNKSRLFKRDFAGEMLDIYEDLKLVKYGFLYHREPLNSDDINWFLLEKN
ncbi:pseudaminic acid biosynthesis-associated methylase [bacterium]|nr:MAG: pseudaminic acid biosynthesis-associated methylase [bacterium]